MSGGGEYNFSLTTFSPSGKLVQIEYALNRVSQGAPALGIRASNGVVLAAEKKVNSTLVDDSSWSKIESVTSNIGCVCVGMPGDYRVLLRKGRKAAASYKLFYKKGITVNMLVQEAAHVMQEYTQSGGVRPFGTSLLVAGWDESGPQLYQVDPAGSYFGWKASAIGRDSDNMKNFLDKRYQPDIEVEDAVHTAILTLREASEGAMTEKNLEIGIIGTDRIFKRLSPQEVKDYLDEVE